MKWLVALALAGCNAVLGLAETTEVSAPGPALLTPPDGGTTCDPPPRFETWTVAAHPIAGFSDRIDRFTFLASDRVVFASGGRLFESGVDGPAAPITSLELGDNATLGNPMAAPGGDVLWFTRVLGSDPGVFYATKETGQWLAHRAQLPVTGFSLSLGGIGFYAGTARMLVGPDVTSVVELSSHDGLMWTPVQTMQLPKGALLNPTLDVAACVWLYSESSLTHLQYAGRAPDGTFATAMDVGVVGSAPALDPTLTRLWFVQNNKLMQATP